MDPSLTARTELDAIRLRRAELREALDDLERALVAPAAGRAVIWGEAVHACAVELADDFTAHADATEGPGGLHHAILAGDLRLANAVIALSGEHQEIASEIGALVSESAAPVMAGDVDAVRERGTRLLGRLVRHRQRGADLIFDAYQTDIGGGD